MIDLRSDTVTKPTPEMREAMAKAEVGDDVYREDPTINRLEAKAAEIFGREAALFVPSGTMGNAISVKVHTRPTQEVILDERCHIYNYELAGMSAISGVIPRPLPGRRGALTAGDIKKVIRPKKYHLAQTGLIALENTHNMWGGAIYPEELTKEVTEFAMEAGIPTHLDGARVFNAAVARGKSVAELTRGFDTVMVCLSKGLSAPVGSIILGSREIIEKARIVRKMLGGGMRQAGVLAAAGIIALEKMVDRLKEDHDNAKLLAEGLAELPLIRIDPDLVETNIVIFELAEGAPDAEEVVIKIADRGVLSSTVGEQRIRMVTHYGISRGDIERGLEIIREVLG
jgi:threonine aldolase